MDGDGVRSVDRAAALLLALGESQGEAGVTELSRRLGLHKSTASRLLATLHRRGLVEQDGESGKYRLGLVVIRLAERAERTLDLRSIALPELERLARVTHETAGLGVLDADRVLLVAQVDGPNLIASGDWTGRASTLHANASGNRLARRPRRSLCASAASPHRFRAGTQPGTEALPAAPEATASAHSPRATVGCRIRTRPHAPSYPEPTMRNLGVSAVLVHGYRASPDFAPGPTALRHRAAASA